MSGSVRQDGVNPDIGIVILNDPEPQALASVGQVTPQGPQYGAILDERETLFERDHLIWGRAR